MLVLEDLKLRTKSLRRRLSRRSMVAAKSCCAEEMTCNTAPSQDFFIIALVDAWI